MIGEDSTPLHEHCSRKWESGDFGSPPSPTLVALEEVETPFDSRAARPRPPLVDATGVSIVSSPKAAALDLRLPTAETLDSEIFCRFDARVRTPAVNVAGQVLMWEMSGGKTPKTAPRIKRCRGRTRGRR